MHIWTLQKGCNLCNDVRAPDEGGRRSRQGVRPCRDLTPERSRATLPVALEILHSYMEGAALFRGRQLAAADRTANRSLVEAEQPRGLPRRQIVGHTTGEIWALSFPGVFPLA